MADRRRGRGMAGGNLNRVLAMAALMPLASRSHLYARLAWSLATDDRVPGSRKALLAVALAYVAVPFDFVPDDVPFLGLFDDLVVAVLALDLFFDGIPDEILDEKLQGVGLERGAFERDLRQLRRMTPRPVRMIAQRLPDLVDAGAIVARAAGLGPRVRRFISKEGSFA